MFKDMLKKIITDKKILTLYVVIISCIVIGVTYAASTASLTANLDAALLTVDESAYGSTSFDSSNLDLKPILDSEVETKTNNVLKIDFTVGGSNTNVVDDIIYDIALVDLDIDCNLLSPYMKWKLVKDGAELSSGSLDYKFDTIVNGRLVLTNIQQDLPSYSASKSGYHNYTFYLWFSDSCQSDMATCISNNQIVDQSNLLGRYFSGKIEVELYTDTKKSLVRKPSTTLNENTCFQVDESENVNKPDTTVCSNVTYTGNSQTLITNGALNTEGIVYSNYTGTNIGNYEITASLDDGYVWGDGTFNEVSITCPVLGVITYNANGGSSLNYGENYYQFVNKNEGYVLSSGIFSKEGYVFAGWNTKADGSGDDWTEFIGTTNVWTGTDNLTLYAQWNVANTVYTVSYNGNGNTGGFTSESEFSVGAAGNLAINGFEKTGYAFNGWNTTANGNGTAYNNGQSIINLASAGETLTLYAQWRPITYTISYYSNCATGGGSTASSNHTYGIEQSLTLNGFTCVGHTFTGWNTSSTGNGVSYIDGQSVSNLTTNDGGSVTLHAQWSKKSYTVTLTKGTGISSVTGAGTYTYGQSVTISATPSTGYSWNNWTGTHSTTTQTYTFTMPASDVSDTANATINSYTVTLTKGTGISSVTGAGTYTYGQSVTINATASTGYTWNKWTGTHSTTTKSYTFTMPASNVSDTANANANTYTVSYNGNGNTGGSTASSSHIYGKSKALTANGFTKTGYSFVGWNTAANGSGTSYSNSQSVKNLTSTNNGTVTLYAQWTATVTTINANRYHCATYSSESSYRLSIMYTTTCTGGTCNYTSLNGLTSSSINSSLVALNNFNWTVAESSLSASVPSNCSGNYWYVYSGSGLNCRSNASTSGSIITALSDCSTYRVQRTSLKYDSSGNNWYYYFGSNCYLAGAYLYSSEPSSCSSSSGGGGTGDGGTTEKLDLCELCSNHSDCKSGLCMVGGCSSNACCVNNLLDGSGHLCD